jgi:hypothetical protein
MVRVTARTLAPFERFSLYNSPYPAQDTGRAIDLYPPDGTEAAPSPVAGTVIETRQTRAPDRPNAERHDHVIVVDTGERLARLLHVEPTVVEGDTVTVGDALGRFVDSGFFAPWVGPHVHLGFRPPRANAIRATGSLRLTVGPDIEPVDWDGHGRVVESASTYVVLDTPAHPETDSSFVGVSADAVPVALDGGLPHYGGGAYPGVDGSLSLLGVPVGRARGRDVTWADVTVRLDGAPVHGLYLTFARGGLRVSVVCPDHDITVGRRVEISLTAP